MAVFNNRIRDIVKASRIPNPHNQATVFKLVRLAGKHTSASLCKKVYEQTGLQACMMFRVLFKRLPYCQIVKNVLFLTGSANNKLRAVSQKPKNSQTLTCTTSLYFLLIICCCSWKIERLSHQARYCGSLTSHTHIIMQ